jgi:hypothetical protein
MNAMNLSGDDKTWQVLQNFMDIVLCGFAYAVKSFRIVILISCCMKIELMYGNVDSANNINSKDPTCCRVTRDVVLVIQIQ